MKEVFIHLWYIYIFILFILFILKLIIKSQNLNITVQCD
jgi:hypothetical protein